jgi:hypothetical protein
VPFLEHYVIDIDTLLTRVAKLGIQRSQAMSICSDASPDIHALLKRVRGRQVELASEDLLMEITDAVCSSNDPSASHILDSASIAIDCLKHAATRYNASAAHHLNEDLKAASESICSSMCVHQYCRMAKI